MNVLMISWEYPPRIVGGITSHVYNLSQALSEQDVNVYIVTCDFPGAPYYEEDQNVRVFRIEAYRLPAPDFPSWTFLMNMNLLRKTADIIKGIKKVDIIHAHDWLAAPASIGLKHMFRIPLIATIHSTEKGRRHELKDTCQYMIHETESWLTFEAWKVICCSNFMKSDVINAFSLPEDKIVTIYNGVNTKEFEVEFDREKFRKRYALPEEKIILYVGRLVYEKGIHILLEAFKEVLSSINAKLIVAGEGYMKERLKERARQLGIYEKAYFTGFVDRPTLIKLYLCADVCVFPSLYEPFGITALEAMVAKSPVIASNTGGLSEIIEHEVTGIKVEPGNIQALAESIKKVLTDYELSKRLVEHAFKSASERFSWKESAKQTINIYSKVLDEYEKASWKPFS